ncbi:MAG TPA: TonB family protein, partial [Blastocatellia bacterium]|nr:TonB family protein [Blastocatellia bacterium]
MNPRLFFNQLIGPLMRIGTPLLVLLIALTLSQSSNAQALSGSIAGNVKDILNAVVPGAAVRITHKETNQTHETAASSIGSFDFPALQAGTYEITVRMPGFKAYTRNDIEVRLNSITRSDITLEVGAVSEMASITASAPTSGAPRVPEVFDRGFANAAQQGGDSAFQFFSQEMSFDNRLVKGAPFSADVVSETIQTLPDGNRIVQRSEGRIYRDSQGRTRSERTYQMGGSSEQRQVININDPAASASYSLDPETRIARMNSHYFGTGGMTSDMFLTPPFNPNAPSHQPRGVPVGVPGEVITKVQPVYPAIAKQVTASGEVRVEVIIGENGRVISARAVSGHPALRSAAEDAASLWVFKPAEVGGKPVQVPGTLTFVFNLPQPPTSVPPADTGAETAKRLTVSGGVLQGKAIKKVQPPYPPIAKAARASGAVQVQVTISETGEVIEASVISGHPLLRDAALQAARQWLFKPTELSGVPVKVQGILTFNFTLNDEPFPPFAVTKRDMKVSTNTERLAKQMVEGVECEGARAVATMPAGAIGNERPIETVNEIWYSPELQVMILSKRSDPRFGESTYRVTNIVRSEPESSLFQIPS